MLEHAQSNRRLRVLLDALTPNAWEGEGLVVCASPTLASAAQSLAGEVSRCATACAGRTITIIFDAPRAAQASAAPRPGANEHPLVKLAEELLGAKVLRVQARLPRDQA